MSTQCKYRAKLNSGTYKGGGFNTLAKLVGLFLVLSITNVWAYTIQGRFINVDSQGVSGVSISAGGISTSTDATGNYTLNGLAEGTYSVTATASGYKDKTVSNVYVGDNQKTYNVGQRYLVATTNGYRLYVGVQDDKGQILSGASVMVGSEAATLQSSNLYVLNLAATSGTVTVSKPGYTTVSRNFGFNDDSPTATIAWFILVDGGYRVKGRILDIDKNPVAGVQLSLNTGHSAVSNADGTFEIAGITQETYPITLTGKLTGYKDAVRPGYYVNNNVRIYPAGDIYIIKAVDGFRVANCVTYNGDPLADNVQVTVGDKVVRTGADGCYNVGLSNPGTYNYEIKVVEDVPVVYRGETIQLPATEFLPMTGSVSLTEQSPVANPDSAYVPSISVAAEPVADSGTRQKRAGELGIVPKLTAGSNIVYNVTITNGGKCPSVVDLSLKSTPSLPSYLSFVAGRDATLTLPHPDSTHPLPDANGKYLDGINTPLNCNLMDDIGGSQPYNRLSAFFPYFPYSVGEPAQLGPTDVTAKSLDCQALGTFLTAKSSTTVQVVLRAKSGNGDGPPFSLQFIAGGQCQPKTLNQTKRGTRSSGCQTITTPPVIITTPPVLPKVNVTMGSSVTQMRLGDSNVLTYNLLVSNDARDQTVAKNVMVTIPNVPSTLVVSHTVDKGTCRKTATGSLQCLLQDLLSGSQANISLTLTPTQAPLSGSLAAQLTTPDTQDTPQSVALNYTVLPALTECEKNPTCNCTPKPAFCAGIPDLSIVFDDTGSMSEEIEGLRKATTDFVTAVATQPTKPSIQLVSFKDNFTHRVTTDQMATLQAYVNSLWASAGGDCPENSSGAIDWVVNNTTANRLKDGGRILLVTDASPPNGVDLDALIKKLVQRGIKVDVLISGDACVADGKSLSTIDAYSKIAAETHGYFAKAFEINDGSIEGKKKYEDTARQVLFGALFPTILGVDPNKAPQESTLNINLTAANTNFNDDSVVTFQKGDKSLPVNSIKVVSATQLTVNVTLSDTVELGSYDVKVATQLGSFTETATAKGMLEVTGPSLTPDIISVAPTSVMQNYTTEIELSGAGTHFVSGISKLSFDDSGIIVQELWVDNKTALRAKVEITPAAKLGMHPVIVTTGNEVARTPKDLFLVMQESIFAKLKEITPHRGTQGGTLQVHFTGSNTHFVEGTSTLKFSGRGLSTLAFQVLNETQALATLLVDEKAAIGFRDVFISTGDETAVLLNGFAVKTRGCHVVEGYVRSQDNQAVSGVYISLEGQGAFTDATGFYRISGLTEANYTLTATAPGYGFTPQTVYIGGQGDCAEGFIETATVMFQAVSQLAVKIVPKDNFVQCIKQDGQVTYDLITTNLGSQTATGVVLTNLLPKGVSVATLTGANCDVQAGSCQLPNLAPNGEAKVRVVLNNHQDRPLVNRVMVSSNEYPPATVSRWKCVAPHLSVTIKDTPDPVVMQGNLTYLLDVDLSAYAPTPATGVTLVTRLPDGVALKAATTKYGTCDTSNLPTVRCALMDLSIAQATDVSHVTVTLETALQDVGLLLLTLEATVTAQEYPSHLARERTTIFVPPEVKADFIFALDTTESMQPEWNGVIKALEGFIPMVDSSTAPTMALVEFKDTVTVKAFSQNPELILKVIRGLTIGGGDECPEASAEALEVAIKHLADNGTLVLITNASPYPDTDMAALAELIKSKKMKFHAIVTGDCSEPGSWNAVK